MIEINIVHSRVDGRYALILTENTLTYVKKYTPDSYFITRSLSPFMFQYTT